MPRAALILAWVLVAMVRVQTAHAEPGDTCVASYEGAQKYRKQGELVLSKAELRLCSGACPAMLAKDCAKWLGEVDASIARVTIVANDAGGAPVADFAVYVDGLLRPERADLEVNPGEHELRVELPGHTPVTRRFAVSAGQRTREVVTLARVSEGGGALGSDSEELPVGPFVLGGVGLVALGAAGVLAIVGHVNVADLREECAPTCAARRVDAVRDQWTVAGILAGAGGAIVVGAVIWLAVDVADSPVDDGAEQAGRARRRPAVTIEPMQAPPGDVGFGLTTRF